MVPLPESHEPFTSFMSSRGQVLHLAPWTTRLCEENFIELFFTHELKERRAMFLQPKVPTCVVAKDTGLHVERFRNGGRSVPPCIDFPENSLSR